MFLERSACVSSVAIEAAMTGSQCKGEGPREVRDVQGSSMHNENLSSAHSICGSGHSEVFEMEGEIQVKGRDTYFYSFPLLLSLAFLSVRYLNGWIFFPLSIAVC